MQKHLLVLVFLAAFVATAFSLSLTVSEEYDDEVYEIAEKCKAAIPKLEKIIAGLNAEGQTQKAKKVTALRTYVGHYTYPLIINEDLELAREVLSAAEKTLKKYERFWK